MPCTRRADAESQAALSRAKHHAPLGGPRGPGSRTFFWKRGFAQARLGAAGAGGAGAGAGTRPPQRCPAGSRERPGQEGVPASGFPGPRTPRAPRRPPLPCQEGWGCGWGRRPSLSVLGAAQRKNACDPPSPRRRRPAPSRQSPGVRSAPPAPLSVPWDPRPRPVGWRGESANGGPIGLGGPGGRRSRM